MLLAPSPDAYLDPVASLHDAPAPDSGREGRRGRALDLDELDARVDLWMRAIADNGRMELG